LTIGDTIYT